MKKLILLTTLLLPLIMFSQTQLGADINGEAASDYSDILFLSVAMER